jgi:hypothetical protein
VSISSLETLLETLEPRGCHAATVFHAANFPAEVLDLPRQSSSQTDRYSVLIVRQGVHEPGAGAANQYAADFPEAHIPCQSKSHWAFRACFLLFCGLLHRAEVELNMKPRPVVCAFSYSCFRANLKLANKNLQGYILPATPCCFNVSSAQTCPYN